MSVRWEWLVMLTLQTACATPAPRGGPPPATTIPTVVGDPDGFATAVLASSLKDRLTVAERAARAGQPEFALKLYKTCVEGGVGSDRAFFGVWASDLPVQLLWLASRNSAAASYVDDLLESTTRRLLSTPPPTKRDAFLEEWDAMVLLVSLHRGLGSQGRILALFADLGTLDRTGWRRQTLSSLIFAELYEAGMFAEIAEGKQAYLQKLRRGAWEIHPSLWRAPIAGATADQAFPTRLYVALLRANDADRLAVARMLLHFFPEPGAIEELVQLARLYGSADEERAIVQLTHEITPTPRKNPVP